MEGFMNLLAFVEDLQAVIEKVVAFFQGFTVVYGIEVFVFFLLVYGVSKILRENDATKLMLLYWALLFIGGVFNCMNGVLFTERLYFVFVLLLSGFMFLLFSMEVKKSFWDVQKSGEGSTGKPLSGSSETKNASEVEKSIGDIIKAVQNMSKSKTGALIVLSKGSLPKQVLQSGVRLEAEISTPLIEGVFFPNSPLHDGAMIIRGHKIQAAGCFLPLTQKTTYPKEFGTRHRAGIGITEVANVVAIVVSEETGIISIIKQGNVIRFPDTVQLTQTLKDYYWQELPVSDKKSRVVISK